MITQNPIVGRARKKLSGVYARTLYGKNVIQTCPPSTKGKQAASQVAASNAFGAMSRLSNQLSQSELNAIFYQAPNGRSRRSEWMMQLCKGLQKDGASWTFEPSLLQQLGGNAVVTEAPLIVTPTENHLRFSVEDFSAVNRAETEMLPCLILICKDTNQCLSLLPWSSLDDGDIVCENLSPTFLGHECYIYCLWQVNVGTLSNPIYAYGSYRAENNL